MTPKPSEIQWLIERIKLMQILWNKVKIQLIQPRVFLLALVFQALAAQATSGQTTGSGQSELKLSDPVACKSVKGFRDYIELKPTELTTFDKLMIYVEPTGFSTKTEGDKKKAHLVQNARVRAKGAKPLIFDRNELFSYEPALSTGRENLFLAASIGFKNLKPGKYVLELDTIDKLARPEMKITQIIEFAIIDQK